MGAGRGAQRAQRTKRMLCVTDARAATAPSSPHAWSTRVMFGGTWIPRERWRAGEEAMIRALERLERPCPDRPVVERL